MNLDRLLAHRAVQKARSQAQFNDLRTLAEQLELVAIPAPPFGERERGVELAARLHACGLDVETDPVGNVLGMLPRAREPDAPPVLLAAHLDTVFPAETELAVRRSGTRIYAPGITDNTRGLAVLIALARALVGAGVATARPLIFVATVGEEGVGDLRGVKHLFREGAPWRNAAGFVALDGSGLRRIVHRAVGSRRFRVRVRGPGGHSWSDRGGPNPIHALGAAVGEIRLLLGEAGGDSALSVGKIGGGTSVNAIAQEAWIEVDVRSERQEQIARLEGEFLAHVRSAVEAENAARRAGSEPLSIRVEPLGDRPGGETPADAQIVRAAVAATRAVGGRPELAAASTDANVPMSLGVPAVTLGAGGEGGNIHTLGEWYSNRGGSRGIDRALLVALAAAGVEPI